MTNKGNVVKDFSSKKADNFLETDNRDLQFVFTKLKQLELLNQKVVSYLDDNIAKYCQVANVAEKRLILIVANGSIATQIRFQSLDLLRKFKQDAMLRHIQDIQCKVRPAQAGPLTSYRKLKNMPALSNETAEIVRDIAETIEDSALREVMVRIAGKIKQK